MKLHGRAALVTGAARGIGLAIASRFVAEGARVALVDIDASVEGAAKRLGEWALGLVADVTATADVERAVTTVHQRWGRLDVVVNNAGITGGSKLTWEVTDAEWQRVLAVDLTSVFLVSRAAVRVMLGQGSGRIINIASVAGKEGDGRGLRPLRRPRDVLTRVLQQRDLGIRLGDLAVPCHPERLRERHDPAFEELVVVGGQRVRREAVRRIAVRLLVEIRVRWIEARQELETLGPVAAFLAEFALGSRDGLLPGQGAPAGKLPRHRVEEVAVLADEENAGFIDERQDGDADTSVKDWIDDFLAVGQAPGVLAERDLAARIARSGAEARPAGGHRVGMVS